MTAIAWTELPAAKDPPLIGPSLLEDADAAKAAAVRVLASAEVLDSLLNFFRADLQRERLCLLLGRPWRKGLPGEYVVALTRFVPVPCEAASAVHVRMCGGDWTRIWPELDQADGAVLLGWAHSHPGHRAYLSALDLATQACWFAQPWSIALVFDPQRNELRCFAGAGGRPAQLVLDDGTTWRA